MTRAQRDDDFTRGFLRFGDLRGRHLAGHDQPVVGGVLVTGGGGELEVQKGLAKRTVEAVAFVIEQAEIVLRLRMPLARGLEIPFGGDLVILQNTQTLGVHEAVIELRLGDPLVG